MTIEESLHQLLIEKNWKLGLAESCTGGYLAYSLTQLPGASQYFQGSLVTYSNELKRDLLGVKEETLHQYGAVSAETAMEMAIGCLNKTKSDVALSVTGIAGPEGGSPNKPVGLVFSVIYSHHKEPKILKLQFSGTRQQVIENAALVIFNELYAYVRAL